MKASGGMEVKSFLEALAHQLDVAQDALRLKALTGRPLTWALKDLEIDLKVFVELDAQGVMRWRTAGPNEQGASTVRLSFTTITREMVEENTVAYELEDDPRSIDELGTELDPDARRRLEIIGVRTVGQYRRVTERQPEAVQMHTGIPALELQAALSRSARPTVRGQDVVRRGGQELVRIQGANLYDGVTPEVRLAGDPVEVVEATPKALLVRPLSHHGEGQVEVEVSGQRATGFFRLPGRETPAAGAAAGATVAPHEPAGPGRGNGHDDAWDAASGAWQPPGGPR
ncbi:hypothetical protein [Haliangium sp.]|uniref:hypothetical protein n=1 Tax=Haliangium sp. TaxID=2663208 RepID=UPI003D143913